MPRGKGGGPKPTPSYLKLVKGTARPGRINHREPRPAPALPDPPAELNPDARVEWARVAHELHRLGILTQIDRSVLAAYCQCCGRWQQAERALARDMATDPVSGGLLVKTHHGNTINNPLIGIANKAMADMVRYAAELGMTPSARSRIKAEAVVGAGDPSAKYFDPIG